MTETSLLALGKSQLGYDFVTSIDTRYIKNTFLNSKKYDTLIGILSGLQNSLDLTNLKIDSIKIHWDKFNKPYLMNFKILAESYPNGKICDEILNFIAGIERKPKFIDYLMKEMANTKILGKLDEILHANFGNMEEELTEKLMPILESVKL